MSKYLLAYHGGAMAETQEARDQAMAAWGGWFGQLGPAVVDAGNPIANTRLVTGNGAATTENPVSGYSLIEADSLEQATQLAQGCPVLKSGGTVEVGETIDIM
jgi:YCII-related domain-containing protein